jgi:hypothetical protein|uniref:Uncharacterized protein n=2 Tax=unclassified Caudoviricetes TaxID=2788787 RepID=A0A8S5M9V2_9CAUD|nr:MAG TPA: hypothetical protein [Siphoviridae sp. ctsDY37]DAF96037.1 MAG TPA: hypothetical protein [Siphoviridae sp. cteLB10]
MGKDKKEYKEIKGVKEVEETVFDKDQLVSSKKFMSNKDVLSVLIEDGEKITIEEAQKRIETFKKRKVK